MADRGGGAPRGGGFGARGGDRGRGDRGRGGRGGRRGRRGGKSEEKEWQPVTKLGRLVKAGKIKSMEEIYLHSLPIKEYQIVDFFLPKLKDEVMKVRITADSVRRRHDQLLTPPTADQARPETDPCRSADTVQGHRHHRRLGRPRRSRHQDVQGGCHGHSRRHHHCEAQRHPRPARILGHQPRSPPLAAEQGERKVRFGYRPGRLSRHVGQDRAR